MSTSTRDSVEIVEWKEYEEGDPVPGTIPVSAFRYGRRERLSPEELDRAQIDQAQYDIRFTRREGFRAMENYTAIRFVSWLAHHGALWARANHGHA
jgi:hypothetical protein